MEVLTTAQNYIKDCRIILRDDKDGDNPSYVARLALGLLAKKAAHKDQSSDVNAIGEITRIANALEVGSSDIELPRTVIKWLHEDIAWALVRCAALK